MDRAPKHSGVVEKLAGFLLLLLVVGSALSVVYSTYQTRQLFSALQQQTRLTMELEEEWKRLLIEQSTYAAHDRIEQQARERLSMTVPAAESVVVVTE